MTALPDDAVAVDTSVALPLLMRSHDRYDVVAAWADGKTLVLAGHAAAETYSVMTRYPGDAQFAPPDAARVIEHAFSAIALLPGDVAQHVPRILAEAGIFGGATYDGMVALAALHHDLPLATRDRRARPTYAALGVRVMTVV